jgi:hypothetical protein
MQSRVSRSRRKNLPFSELVHRTNWIGTLHTYDDDTRDAIRTENWGSTLADAHNTNTHPTAGAGPINNPLMPSSASSVRTSAPFKKRLISLTIFKLMTLRFNANEVPNPVD